MTTKDVYYVRRTDQTTPVPRMSTSATEAAMSVARAMDINNLQPPVTFIVTTRHKEWRVTIGTRQIIVPRLISVETGEEKEKEHVEEEA